MKNLYITFFLHKIRLLIVFVLFALCFQASSLKIAQAEPKIIKQHDYKQTSSSTSTSSISSIYANKVLPRAWSLNCNNLYPVACPPAIVTVDDLPIAWQPIVLAATEAWNIGTNFHFTHTNIPCELGIIDPRLGPTENLHCPLLLAIGEVRFILRSQVPKYKYEVKDPGLTLPLTTFSHSDKIIAALVILNDTEYSWSVNVDPKPRQADLETVVVHELGHVLGLEHNNNPHSVMAYTGLKYLTGLAMREIGTNDIDSLVRLYGPRSPLARPDNPQLKEPLNNAIINIPNPTFRWQSSNSTLEYFFQLSKSPTFDSLITKGQISNPNFVSSSLESGTYFWRVKASNFGSNSNWSDTWKVHIDRSPNPPTYPNGNVVNTEGLNVRFGPGKNYSVITAIGQNTPVTVIGKDSNACNWLKIIANTNISGWVAAQYITGSPCSNAPVVTPASSATSTPTILPSSATPTPTNQPPRSTPTPTNSTVLIEIVNVQYPSQVAPGQQFRPKVTVRVNTGQLLDVNTRGDMLRNTDGNLFGAHPHVAVDRTVNAGEEYTFTFYEDKPIIAPDQEGVYESKWRVWANGNWVGPEINIHFLVRRNTPTTPNPPSSDYVCGQFIRLNQSEEKWPAFQPYKTNEIWIIAPIDFTNFDATFQEDIYVRIKKPDLGGDLEPAWGYTRVRYLIDSVSDTPVSNCDSITGNALDLSQLKQDILSRLDDAVVSTDYPQQAEQLVNTLFVHFGDFGQNGGSISQDTMQQALQGEEVSLRLNATVQGVWGIWAERGQREGFDPTSTDPGLFPDLSPFRRLIIRLIQGNQGSFSAAEQHAFYSLLTRSEDVETWSNDMNAIVGAINRENFPNEQPAPTPTPIPPPQPPVTSVFLEMVTVPAGNFTMGSSDADIQSVVSECNGVEGNCQEAWFGSEKPARTVFVDTFNISKYEVTNAQYNACVNAGICEVAGRSITDDNITYNPGFFADSLPVVGVSWQDASAFCNWLGERLPTEVEWEKAARGSGDQRRYPWGSDYDPSRANLSSGYPTAVGSYPSGASPYGMMDMAGNVFEWTATADGDKYILRGGGWNNYYYRGRVTDRGTKLPPSFANYDIGFRCVTR